MCSISTPPNLRLRWPRGGDAGTTSAAAAGATVFYLNVDKKQRIWFMQLTLEAICPYHGGMWNASDMSPPSPDQRGALKPNKRIEANGHFRVTLHTKAYLHVDPEVTIPYTVVIDGRFTAAKRARGTATINGPCQWSNAYRHWRIP